MTNGRSDMAYGIAQPTNQPTHQQTNWIDLRRKEISVCRIRGAARTHSPPSDRRNRGGCERDHPSPFIPWILYAFTNPPPKSRDEKWRISSLYLLGSFKLQVVGSEAPLTLIYRPRLKESWWHCWTVEKLGTWVPDAVFDAAGPGPSHWPTS